MSWEDEQFSLHFKFKNSDIVFKIVFRKHSLKYALLGQHISQIRPLQPFQCKTKIHYNCTTLYTEKKIPFILVSEVIFTITWLRFYRDVPVSYYCLCFPIFVHRSNTGCLKLKGDREPQSGTAHLMVNCPTQLWHSQPENLHTISLNI